MLGHGIRKQVRNPELLLLKAFFDRARGQQGNRCLIMERRPSDSATLVRLRMRWHDL